MSLEFIANNVPFRRFIVFNIYIILSIYVMTGDKDLPTLKLCTRICEMMTEIQKKNLTKYYIYAVESYIKDKTDRCNEYLLYNL